MGKLFKILAWTVGILVGLAVLTIIAVKIFYPAEKTNQSQGE